MKPTLLKGDPQHYWWAQTIAYMAVGVIVLILAGGGALVFYGLWRWLR